MRGSTYYTCVTKWFVARKCDEMAEFLKDITPELTIVGALTLIQIAPIKINPWSWLVRMLRTLIGVQALSEQIHKLDTKFSRNRFNDLRRYILEYSRELYEGVLHTESERQEILHRIKEYEVLCKTYGFENSYVEEEIKYIRSQPLKERLTDYEKEMGYEEISDE